jgi:hypothetical protein
MITTLLAKLRMGTPTTLHRVSSIDTGLMALVVLELQQPLANAHLRQA